MTHWIKRSLITALSCSALILSSLSLPAGACTDFNVKAKDGSVVVARTMEWGVDLKSEISTHPRGESVESQAPGGKPGLKWVSKYGYVGLNSQGRDLTLDGMNEKGLSIGFLWLPGSVYQNISAGEEKNSVSLFQFGGWLLGNFASVAEATEAAKNVKVWCAELPEFGGTPTIHIALHDAAGNNAVIEFTDGKMQVFDNPNGVLTNAPTFDWQMTNLRNFINLTPYTHKDEVFEQLKLEPTGQGTGFCGLPGDLTPPSRFVHTTAYVRFAKPAANAKEAVNLAQHIINSVDIPDGVIRTTHGDKTYCDYTQWMVIKDLSNKDFHFRSYSDFALHTIHLNQLNFSAGAKSKSCPIAGESLFCDVSSYLK